MEALARFRSLPLRPPNEWFAEAVRAGARRPAGARWPSGSAMRPLPHLPAGAYLSVNCSHARRDVAASSPSLARRRTRRGWSSRSPSTRPMEDYETLLAARSKAAPSAGVRVAIDDAGAGFASLRHTLLLAPRHREGGHLASRATSTATARKRALASALDVVRARRWGSTIVAEGIETAEELETLRRRSACRYGQGFYLAEPAPLLSRTRSRSVGAAVDRPRRAGGRLRVRSSSRSRSATASA